MKKKLFIGLTLTVLFACKQPCEKTEIGKGRFEGHIIEGHIIVKTYPNCEDTLNYYYKELLPDSSVVMEGKIINNQMQGEWIRHYPDYKNVIVYERDSLIKFIHKDTNDVVVYETYYLNDSIFETINYYPNGKIESKGLKTLFGNMFGTWLKYDSIGQFEFKGDYKMLSDTTTQIDSNGVYYTQVVTTPAKVGIWTQRNLITNQIDTIRY